jgi:hypothetical protein
MLQMPPDAARQLEEWKALAGYWKTVSGALTPITALIPVSGFFTDFACVPGADKIQSGFGVVFAALMVPALFYIFRKGQGSTIQLVAIIFFCGAMLLGVLYLILLVTQIESVDEQRYLISPALTDRAQKALAEKEITSVSPKALLDYFGHASEDDIWAHRTCLRAVMVVSFVMTFASLTSAFFLWTLKSFVVDCASTSST